MIAGRLAGPDVSYAQGAIAWSQVHKGERELAFAIAKATEGTTLRDRWFPANWHGMREEAGLLRGAYHFARPSATAGGAAGIVAQARAQAEHFVAALEAVGGIHAGDLPPALDLEVTAGLRGGGLSEWVFTWVEAVHRHVGRRPMIYTNSFWAENLPEQPHAWGCPLWAAAWGPHPPRPPRAWRAWTFWQHTNAGRLPGIRTAVDLNVFDGTRAQLVALAGGAPARHGGTPPAPDHHRHPPTPPAPTPTPEPAPAHHPAPAWPGEVLRVGSRGAAVHAWQERMRGRGFALLHADGVYGPRSREACRWLQLYLEDEPTGEVDERLWHAAWTPA